MSFSSDYDAGSANDVSTVINATFTGTGTLEVGFVNDRLDTISINQRSLKVIVKGYTGISDTFANMTEINRLIIVDLSGMENTGDNTQGLVGAAFGGCTNLREITLFPNCTDIETAAFNDCTLLTKIYKIPSGITAETSGVNTIFGGSTKDNMVSIFDIALGITERDVASMSAEITYSPSSAPDPEITVETYSVTATATLNSPNNDYVASKIFSETVNSKPVITSSATFSVPENQTSIGTVTATDADGNTSFTYSLSGTDSSELAINSSSGVLTFVTAPDFETKSSYTATVTVSDETTSVTQDITVNVTNLNDNTPSITSGATFTAAENQTAIGTVTATDADGNSLTYSVSGSELAINSSSGVLTFVTAPDFETKSTYNATVTVSDGTNSTTQDITVNVTNVNEAPTFTSSATFTAAENQTAIGTVTATNPDSGTLEYSVSGSELAINSSSGVLTFVTAPDYETKNTYTATVTVSDGTNSTTQDITVNVTNVNEAPTFTSSATFTATENQTAIGTVTATNPDSGTLEYSVSGSELAINSSSGVLTFVTAPDYETKNTYTATVTVSDGTNSTTQDITVNVTNVNEGPTFTSSATFSVPENQTSIGTVTATNPDSGTLEYSVSGSELAINSSSGVLTFVTAPDYETKNTYTATVTVSDGTTSVTQDITVNVTNVNKAPTFTSSAVTSAKVGFEYTYTAVASDDDGDTVTLSGTPIPGWLSFNTSTGKLTGTPGIDNVGNHNVVLTATDSNSATATQSFTITVSRFKPANKTELQSAIDKWYELANGAK